MSDLKTVDVRTVSASPDALINKKQEDVAEMQASLLACSDNPEDIGRTVRKVTVLRVIHQVSRIVTYLDMMDRIEEKLYESIDNALDSIDTSDPVSWNILLNIQSRLQNNMIESHKLLEPYLSEKTLNLLDISEYTEEIKDNNIISFPQESRDKLRENAQRVLEILESGDSV